MKEQIPKIRVFQGARTQFLFHDVKSLALKQGILLEITMRLFFQHIPPETATELYKSQILNGNY